METLRYVSKWVSVDGDGVRAESTYAFGPPYGSAAWGAHAPGTWFNLPTQCTSSFPSAGAASA